MEPLCSVHGGRQGSQHFLEATVECCDSSFFSTLCEKAVMGKVRYAADGLPISCYKQ